MPRQRTSTCSLLVVFPSAKRAVGADAGPSLSSPLFSRVALRAAASLHTRGQKRHPSVQTAAIVTSPAKRERQRNFSIGDLPCVPVIEVRSAEPLGPSSRQTTLQRHLALPQLWPTLPSRIQSSSSTSL
ncbi:hypothetical protein K491DRAFT_698209 [Lophiostoma macrostomum CBS 122681]|uniref:Uncharacterized protein n=1 Tax=Lophiostoma macrostomum CBS 122681 TaxID=1314788 RepID=A0A6A6SQR5_9PLEO|nr:hypothetical protein K491DRAFT_698209 [Lophiostoma macrostomum CBS 122681]